MVTKWGKINCLTCGLEIDKEYSWSKYCSIKCRTKYSSLRRNLKGRRNDILRKFNMKKEKYEEILKYQNNVCAICGKKESAKSSKGNKIKELAVDHSHKTGIIRGLLCMSCNRGLGCFYDDTSLLEKAIKYLENNK